MILLQAALFFFFHYCSASDKATACINNYQDLRLSILNNSENFESLLKAFYPPNKSPAHLLNVYYYISTNEEYVEDLVGNETHPHFEKPNVTADHIFQWVDSSTLLLTEFKLFHALSFGIAALETGEVRVQVDPFCNEDDEVELLNLATIWLKTFTIHDKKTEYYYSMYFNNEKFVVLGNSVRSSTSALVTCEYFASIGAILAVYTILLLCKYDLFASMRRTMSDVSVPCFVFTLTILVRDILSYTRSFRYVSSEWNVAFPIPYVYPIFAMINIIVASIVVAVIGTKFPVPALLELFYTNIGLKGRFYYSVVQVILVFSITSFTVLITFHFAWVVLAFSAYPVRSLASQAFTIPFLVISFAIYFAATYVLSYPTVVLKVKEKTQRLAVAFVTGILTMPFIIALLGVLYYYSQVLIDVNDSQNYPIKTVIGGLVPTLITALGAWALRNTLKAWTSMIDNKIDKLDSDVSNRESENTTRTEMRELHSFANSGTDDIEIHKLLDGDGGEGDSDDVELLQ